MSPSTDRKSSVCIVGVGAQTAVGLTAPASAAAVRAGISGFGEHPFMIDRQGEPMIVARVPSADDLSGCERFLRLSAQPAREALTPLEGHLREVGAIPLFLGLPPQRPGRPADLDGRVTDFFRRDVGVASVECISTGHAAGLMALEAASRRVSVNPSSFCLAGGLDSYLEAETLEWLEQNDQLH